MRYAGSTLSGAKSSAQMQFKTMTIVVSLVQLPVLASPSTAGFTIKDTVTDTPLPGDIGM
jgi:hypothetical protein